MEPAVVEHEPFHAQTGGPADQVQHHVGVLIEVQCLPHVQRHRLAGRVRRQRTLPGVQTVRHAVQAVVAGGDHDPRRRVRVAGGQDHLARLQQLTGEHRGSVLGDAVDGHHRVAAPRRLHAEHGTGAETEAFGARDQRGAFEAGLAASEFAHPGAVGDPVALRLALVLMPAGEVDELALVVAQRDADLQPVDHIAAGAARGRRPDRRS